MWLSPISFSCVSNSLEYNALIIKLFRKTIFQEIKRETNINFAPQPFAYHHSIPGTGHYGPGFARCLPRVEQHFG